MALDSYVKVVRGEKEAQKRAASSSEVYSASREVYAPKPEPQIIDAEKIQATQSTNPEQTEIWKTCQHLMEKDGEFYCRYFVSKCGKEKCNKKFLNTTKKIPKL